MSKNLFYSTNPSIFAFQSAGGRYWYALPEILTFPDYPRILDFFDFDFSDVGDTSIRDLLDKAKTVVAPTWDDISPIASHYECHDITFDDIPEQESSFPQIRKISFLARAAAKLGKDFGLVVSRLETLDSDTQIFVRCLIESSKSTEFGVIIDHVAREEIDPENFLDFSCADVFLEDVDADIKSEISIPFGHPAHNIMSLTEAILPKRTFESMGFEIPEEYKYIKNCYVKAEFDKNKDISREKIINSCKRIASCINMRDFDYIRRYSFLIRSKMFDEIVKGYHIYRFAFASIGKEFLFHHYVAMSEAKISLAGDKKGAAFAQLCAARLAPRVSIENGFEKAISIYNRVLSERYIENIDLADAGQQLANIQAVSGNLSAAQQQYDSVCEYLSTMDIDKRSLRIHVRVLNGRALIAYRQNDPELAEKRKPSRKAVLFQAFFS